jgi:TonB family protein
MAHAAAFVAVIAHPTAHASLDSADSKATIDIAAPEMTSDDPPRPPARAAIERLPMHAHTHPYPGPASHDGAPHDPSLVHAFASTPPALAAEERPAEGTPAMTPSAMPHFTIAIGPGTAPAVGPSAGTGGGADGGAPLPEQNVSSPARLVRGKAPPYPSEARAQGVEADVPLEIVLSAEGAVESACVLQHAGFGFDEAALEAIREYRFAPATRDGRAVSVRMRWTMEFRLR